MYALVYITTSGEKESKKIGRTIVEERLAGCINIISTIESLYWWKGKIEEDTESILIVKTKVNNIENIIKRVKEIHSYENPAILAIPIIEGSKEYLDYLDGEIR
ncbi:divalent-cation tolerance protein CutA [Methanobacterium veterum]|jgi:periplasmic divalent cation tolerance protein|uniref:Divalent-cation tolerance protein CutA n=2 Tax=Methanobacteriaceae TaxID=2159 RepID=A0A9E4ZZP0_9EURY|nr:MULTISPECIES: divalent-cation tolerance protein CutA [Methanobacterium]MCZ3365490.1 divalent-cation tolerance protein CutA [Methanobacterium veterum]MCZ3373242.1 divalent-cation tolerance protein CutA [Methanobacterium veterum]